VKPLAEIAAVLCGIQDPKTMDQFLRELFTGGELATLELRWRLLKDLFDGTPQRKIAETHRISLCKITRGSKVLKKRGSVVRKILEAARGDHHEHEPHDEPVPPP
jgi:TrpR family trp operon transcriptional repressor